MNSQAVIGHVAPPLQLSEWVQGGPVNFDTLFGRTVLVEIFQVNCPGCFLYALPQAIQFYNRYESKGLCIIGVATAFEDFDKNTPENLRLLAESLEVIGETKLALERQGLLENGRLPYRIPFPLAMDRLVQKSGAVTEAEIEAFIADKVADFALHPNEYQDRVRVQVGDYLQKLEYRAETFETFRLKGTPSNILVDKNGILRDCTFGHDPNLESKITQLLHA